MNRNTATEKQRPDLLAALEELNRAVEVVRTSTAVIYDHLRLSQPGGSPKGTQPETSSSLIRERIQCVKSQEMTLYCINGFLEEIITVVREI
jgi:hypothetical protein